MISTGPPPKLAKGGIPGTGGAATGAVLDAPVTVNQRPFVVTDPVVTVIEIVPITVLGTTAEIVVEFQLLITAVNVPNLTVP
jgi:hypothetical protein